MLGLVGFHRRGEVWVVVPVVLPAVRALRALRRVVSLERRRALVAPSFVPVPGFIHLTTGKGILQQIFEDRRYDLHIHFCKIFYFTKQT